MAGEDKGFHHETRGCTPNHIELDVDTTMSQKEILPGGLLIFWLREIPRPNLLSDILQFDSPALARASGNRYAMRY